MQLSPTLAAPPVAAEAPRRAGRSLVTPGHVHALSLAGSLAFWAWNDRKLWFFGDEWDFLERRGLSFPPGSDRSIWFPHNEHWSTLPILLWRGLYSAFHLSSYWPYLAPLLLAGAAVAHLAWRLAKNAGADPWVATAATALLAFSGAGAENMTSAFQVSFVGSVLFGLIALAVLLRSGPRADWAVSVALLASLMCSTVGDPMVVGTAVVLPARRRPRRAAGILVLPIGSYLVWFSFLGRPSVSAPRDHFGMSSFTTVPSYVLSGLSGALGHSFLVPSAGGVLLSALAVWVASRLRQLWEQAPALLGLCAAVISFYVLAALGRDRTAGAFIVVSRYVWVAMALLVPVIARALSPPGAAGKAQQRPSGRPLRAVATVWLAATAFAGTGQAEAWVAGRNDVTSALHDELLAVAQLVAHGVPDVSGPAASPIRLYPDLSVASIRRLALSGALAGPAPAPASLAEARTALALGTWDGSRTALTKAPMFAGRFSFLWAAHALASPAGSCSTFDPRLAGQPIEIWLSAAVRTPGSSLEVVSTPSPPGSTGYVGAALASPGERSGAPVELEVPAGGRGYLSDDEPGSVVLLIWRSPAPVEVCGLSG